MLCLRRKASSWSTNGFSSHAPLLDTSKLLELHGSAKGPCPYDSSALDLQRLDSVIAGSQGQGTLCSFSEVLGIRVNSAANLRDIPNMDDIYFLRLRLIFSNGQPELRNGSRQREIPLGLAAILVSHESAPCDRSNICYAPAVQSIRCYPQQMTWPSTTERLDMKNTRYFMGQESARGKLVAVSECTATHASKGFRQLMWPSSHAAASCRAGTIPSRKTSSRYRLGGVLPGTELLPISPLASPQPRAIIEAVVGVISVAVVGCRRTRRAMGFRRKHATRSA